MGHLKTASKGIEPSSSRQRQYRTVIPAQSRAGAFGEGQGRAEPKLLGQGRAGPKLVKQGMIVQIKQLAAWRSIDGTELIHIRAAQQALGQNSNSWGSPGQGRITPG